MTKASHLSQKAINAVSRILCNIAGYILAVMMFLTTGDVLLRYSLNSPIPGAFELTEVLQVVVVILGMAYVAVKKGHIRVEILISRLPTKAQLVVGSISLFVALVLFSLIVWQAVVYANIRAAGGDTTAILSIPIFPFYLVIAAGIALLCLVLLRDLCSSLAQVVRSGWKVRQWLIPLLVLVLLGATAPLWLQLLPAKIGSLTVGYIGLCVFILVLFSGMPIGFVMALVAFIGMLYIRGIGAGLMLLGTVPYTTSSNYTLSILPLFVLMGIFCSYSRVSQDLYYAAYKWIGPLPGGLAMGTIAACAGFAAVCGSSVAEAAAMGTVAIPEMRRYKYDSALATGSVAAGGTLGILIPPSIGFIVYGMTTGQSVGKLFIAGILPGLLLASLFMTTIYILCRRNPNLGPPGPKSTPMQMVAALKGAWPVLILFLTVIGGLYMGVFTPTEAGGVGAFGAFLFAISRKLSWQNFVAILIETVETTSMVFIILIGATMLSNFLAATNVPFHLAGFVVELGLPRYFVYGVVLLLFLILGCLLEPVSLILLVVPIFFPLLMSLGFDPLWFGVIVVIMVQAGLITPPVGLNVFVIAGIAKDVPMYTIFRGIIPFLVVILVCVVILTLFPQIVTFLPSLMS